MSKSPSSSRPGSPAPAGSSGSNQTIDPYRPIATQVKKPLLPLIASSSSTTPNLPSLLSLDPATYSTRLSGKTLLFNDSSTSAAGGSSNVASGSSSSSSALVKGKKRNRGNDEERLKARNEAETIEKERGAAGTRGMRKLKKKAQAGGVVQRGAQTSYASLLPLHHLHTLYLFALLSLPPLPPHPAPLPTTLPVTNHETLLSKISKADLTGAELSVVSSRNPSLNGIRGLVIEETAGTFRIVTLDDSIKIVPKDGTLFRLSFPAYSPRPPSAQAAQIASQRDAAGENNPTDLTEHLSTCPRIEIDLLGTAFGYRSGHRAGRKFRPAQGGGGGSGWGEEWVQGDWRNTLSSLASLLGEDQKEGVRRGGKSGRKDGIVGSSGRRKRGKSRRKDPPAGGNLEVN